MERREFLSMAAKGAVAAAALAACSPADEDTAGTTATTGEGGVATTGNPDLDDALTASDLPELSWDLATSWPTSLDTIFGGAVTFAERVTAMTQGRFTITARAGGEVVPPLEILQSAQANAIDAGHTASYYYVGLAPLNAFGTAVPFGLTARQQNGWLYYGGGLDMLQQVYAERFNTIQFPAGNTGVQMGGWFNKEINTVADLEGLIVRIPGLGGSVLERLGAVVQTIPGGEIFQALQTGAVDGAEWVGPYDDLKLELNTVTQFYYYPGWWEPGPTLEVQIPLDTWNGLPAEYQEVIKTAAAQANVDMMASYDAKNPGAFQEIQESGTVEIIPFPDVVLNAAEEAAFEIYDENAAADSDFQSIFDNWRAYRTQVKAWHATAETAMLTYESVVG